MIAPGNVATVSQFDSRGNLLSQVDSLGRRVDMKYDPTFSQLLTLLDPLGLATSFARDGRGNAAGPHSRPTAAPSISHLTTRAT